MPELPEVESVRRQLEPALVGRRFERVAIDDPRLVRPYDPVEVAAELEGERVATIERRGKYLVVRFESGRVLLIHLRMTGNLLHGSREQFQDLPHRRAVVTLDDGSDVAYRDVRRFGTWLLLEPEEAEPYLSARVGDEPLDTLFTAARLGERLASRRTSLKAALLDQRIVAGLGNIYVCEALHRALLSPKRRASTIATRTGAPNDRAERLVDAIKAVLNDAIKAGGSSLRDHRRTDGELGMFQHNFRVYDREGAKCPTPGCKGTIKRIVQTGRSTFFCPVCQK
jgi:formamidopyrimidine-DNA glycosylase